MINIHWINETLAWLDNDEQKLKFLDNVQTDIMNILNMDDEAKARNQETYDYATEKAKKILNIC